MSIPSAVREALAAFSEQRAVVERELAGEGGTLRRKGLGEVLSAIRFVEAELGTIRDPGTAAIARQRLKQSLAGSVDAGWFGPVNHAVELIDARILTPIRAAPQENPRAGAVRLLKRLITEEARERILDAIRSNPSGWQSESHFGLGMAVRNNLREHGYTESVLAVENLDEIWADLLCEALELSSHANAVHDPVETLLDEIDAAPATAFWYGSKLLARCIDTPDRRVSRDLALRHQARGNKAAGSAHVRRQTIKRIEGRELEGLWELLDESLCDPLAEPDQPSGNPMWAAANIIGEVGGSPALHEICRRVENGGDHLIYVRILAHLVLRYIDIASQEQPKYSLFDVRTRKEEEHVLTEGSETEEVLHRIVADRKAADEWFGLVPPSLTTALTEWLGAQSPSAVYSLLRSGNGIPASDPDLIPRMEEQLKRQAQEEGYDAVMRTRESEPQHRTLPDLSALVRGVTLLASGELRRDVVLARRRTWTALDQSDDFLLEKRWSIEDLTCEVWLDLPGHPYPHRGVIKLSPAHDFFGWTDVELTEEAQKLGLPDLGFGRIDRSHHEGGEWCYSFACGGFYEDVDWSAENVNELAEALLALLQARRERVNPPSPGDVVPREDAWELADRSPDLPVREVLSYEELQAKRIRPPCLYSVKFEQCWIAYHDQPFGAIRLGSSLITLIHRSTGELVYHGPANDEG
jgi:hypothetical protein